jgi:oligopeptide transport system substrate-binding protein
MIKHIILIVVTAIPLFCSPLFSSPADEAIKEGILLLGNGSEPHSLDPHINSSMNGHHVIMSLIEGLIAPHPTDDSLPHPGIAYKWENENNTVWTFHLRDTNWTNGDPVTAEFFRPG